MMDEQQARYADLIECSARILAFDGLIDAALPVLASALTSEAVDLRNGWAKFFPNDEAGAADLPIVDAVISEVFARSNALRLRNFRQSGSCRDCKRRGHANARTFGGLAKTVLCQNPKEEPRSRIVSQPAIPQKWNSLGLGAVRRHRRTVVPAGAVAYGRRHAGPSAAVSPPTCCRSFGK